MPLFISDEGRVLAPTAKAVWDRLIDLDGDAEGIAHEAIGGETSSTVFEQAYKEAAKHGHTVFTELLASHEQRQIQQRNKGRRAFESRRIAIDRIGLPQVRNHRLRELEKEEVEWQDRIAAQDLALPELTALILVRVARSEDAE
jgi:predicted protein tyrosine phosphatase